MLLFRGPGERRPVPTPNGANEKTIMTTQTIATESQPVSAAEAELRAALEKARAAAEAELAEDARRRRARVASFI